MMWITWLSVLITGQMVVLFLVNLCLFRRSPRCNDSAEIPAISVLIPARNEGARIGALLQSILASDGIEFEIRVLDDQSTDDTAEVVQSLAAVHPQLVLMSGVSIPAGWNGKQHACYQLANAAKYEELVFIDADVFVTKDALRRAVSLRRTTGVDLLSGFPLQRVVTLGEALLIPLIHLVLLCFLPFPLMRYSRQRGAAAGCGQLFLTTKTAYQAAGGHASIRDSFHDGIMLPRSYRGHGLKTDLFDASDLATCRMYGSLRETWSGLKKNAHEGFANMPLLLFITLVMFLVYVYPVSVVLASAFGIMDASQWRLASVAAVLGYLPRVVCCVRFDHAWLGCLLNPLSIVLFLLIQWEAWFHRLRGRGIEWRSRNYGTTTT
jgi:glycosyltransferase involved in cell wall biosynthesis